MRFVMERENPEAEWDMNVPCYSKIVITGRTYAGYPATYDDPGMDDFFEVESAKIDGEEIDLTDKEHEKAEAIALALEEE